MGATKTAWDTAHMVVAEGVWKAPDGSLLTRDAAGNGETERVYSFLEGFPAQLGEKEALKVVLREFPNDAKVSPMPVSTPLTCKAWTIHSRKMATQAHIPKYYSFVLLTTESVPAGSGTLHIQAYNPAGVTHADVQTVTGDIGQGGCGSIGDDDQLSPQQAIQ